MNDITIKDFFKDKTMPKLKKTYLINAEDYIDFGETDTLPTLIFFNLTIKRVNDDLYFKIKLYSWSNNKQKYVSLKKSICKQDKDFSKNNNLKRIKKYYKRIKRNFLNVLADIKYNHELRELLHRLENPTFIFHYKLLNLLSLKKLEHLTKQNFENYPILNISLFYTSDKNKSNIGNMFLPNYIKGFYMDGIEVCILKKSSEIAIIKDLHKNTKLSKEEFLKRIHIVNRDR